ncbi:hypothetical protein [Salegentibacter sp. UBA1130]|uniref:hypothetical protein n=1 Tax=Salegentibacter sp. UBA1130 TaxID=1947451 RepID=UPI002580778B|nr:hypothetical protein [Salegentibacter sp. UBA1130]
MNHGFTISGGDSFEENCGAKFKVNTTKQKAHNDREEYNCPECGKTSTRRASLPFRDRNINLILPRTDGRTDRYNGEILLI